MSLATALRRLRLASKRLASAWRRLFFSIELNFAMKRCLSVSVDERHLEAGEQRLGFLVRPCGGHDDDVHAPGGIDLVVIDLREHQLLLEAERVVATAVEALAGEAAEVAHARQRDVDERSEERRVG